jgi:excisionase family DNA binding protein
MLHVPRSTRPITLQEAADRLGVHYMTAYRYVRTGRLPAEREGVQWMVDPSDVDALRAPRPVTRRGSVRTEGPRKLAARMVAGDEAGAWTIVEAALASGLDPADVYLDLLVPALRSVGDDWASGTVSVADEHRATTVTQRLIGRLGPRFARRGRKRGTVVVGAPPGEQHALPTAIVGDLLRGAGFEVLDMGADAPAESFAETAGRANRLVAVAIAATTPGSDAAVRSAVRALRGAGIAAPILVGGAAVADVEHARRLGADGWSGSDGRSALGAIERVSGGATPASPGRPARR